MNNKLYLELIRLTDQAEGIRASNDDIEKAKETHTLTAELQLFIHSIDDSVLRFEASRLLGDLVNQPKIHIGDKILIVKIIQALKQITLYAEEYRVKKIIEKKDKMPMKNSTPTVGTTFHTTFDEYKLLKQIGNGGVGTVYESSDASGKHVAIKVMKSGLSTEQRKRFKNEIYFCQKNTHPGIIQILDHGIYHSENDSYLFYVMPLYKGTFREHMTKLTPNECLPYIIQLLNAIEVAHLQKCFHRDFKPENILVNDATNELVISDFGIAHFDEADLLTEVETKHGSRMANFIYAAPEQKIKGAAVDHRADIYALGMIFNEMFTHEQPHGNAYKKVGEASADHAYLDSIFDRMMHTKAENRFQDIASIKAELSLAAQIAISQQRVDKIKNTVITTTDANMDPLVATPLKIEKSDYDGANLICKMNQAVTRDWFNVLQNGGANVYSSMTHWRKLNFKGDLLTYGCHIDYAVQTKGMVQQWVDNTNRIYKLKVEQDLAQKALDERVRAEKEIAFEKKRQELLKNLNG